MLLFERRCLIFTKTAKSLVIELRAHPELISDASEERLINVCVGVNSVHLLKDDGSKIAEINPLRHDFTRIYLPDNQSSPASYMLDLNIYNPISIAYSALSSRKSQETTISIHTGDLEAVISPYYPINEGDLILMTRAQNSAKELTAKQSDGRFYLKYGPLVSLDKLYAPATGGAGYTEIEPDAAVIDGFHSFYLRDRNIQSLSVAYSYHPQYRVKERLEYSALEDRRQPIKWRLSPEHTNLVFA